MNIFLLKKKWLKQFVQSTKKIVQRATPLYSQTKKRVSEQSGNGKKNQKHTLGRIIKIKSYPSIEENHSKGPKEERSLARAPLYGGYYPRGARTEFDPVSHGFSYFYAAFPYGKEYTVRCGHFGSLFRWSFRVCVKKSSSGERERGNVCIWDDGRDVSLSA